MGDNQSASDWVLRGWGTSALDALQEFSINLRGHPFLKYWWRFQNHRDQGDGGEESGSLSRSLPGLRQVRPWLQAAGRPGDACTLLLSGKVCF